MTGDMRRRNDSKLVLVGSLTARDTIQLQLLGFSIAYRTMFHICLMPFRLSILFRERHKFSAKKKQRKQVTEIEKANQNELSLIFN